MNIMRKERHKLGSFEAYCASNPACVVCMVAHLTKESERMDNRDAFLFAVRATCRRHPNLYSLLIPQQQEDGMNTELYLETQSELPNVEKHVEIIQTDENNTDWKQVVHRECNHGYDLKGSDPYWNVVLVHEESHDILVMKLHHCIADGTSGYILIHDILQFYYDYTSRAHDGTHHQVSVDSSLDDPLPVLPSVDEMCFPTGNEEDGDDFDETMMEQRVQQLEERKANWLPMLECPSEEVSDSSSDKLEHNILYRDGTESNLKSLLQKCREEQVTIGAVLIAAMYFGVAKVREFTNKKQLDGGPVAFDFDVDVNLRKYFAIDLGNDHVGAYIAVLPFQFTVDPHTPFWDLCMIIKRAIQDSLDEKQHLHYSEVIRRLEQKQEKDHEKEAESECGKRHGLDLNFSNLGRYFFPPSIGSLQIDKIYCVGGGWNPMEYAFLITSVKTMNYSFVYKASEWNDTVAGRLFHSVVGLAERASTLSETYTLADFISKESLT